jgi:hypothetical protein
MRAQAPQLSNRVQAPSGAGVPRRRDPAWAGCAKRHEINRNLVRIWVAKYEAGSFDSDVVAADIVQAQEARIAALERLVGKLALENEFLKGVSRDVPRPRSETMGDAYDNAMAESFFATLECELLARSRFKTQAEARNAVFEFIEGFYNPRRRHSSLGYLSPVEFERRHRECAASPGARHPAAVLGAVKDKPSLARKVRVLECVRDVALSVWCKSRPWEVTSHVAEGNCVAAMRGGEQPEANEQPAG